MASLLSSRQTSLQFARHRTLKSVCLYSVILLVRPNAARPNRTQSLERAEGFDFLLYLLCLLNVLCLLVFKPAPQSSAPHKTPPHRPKTRPPPQDDVRSKSLPP